MPLALTQEMVIAFMLAMARVGALVMLMPGLGERVIPARQRMVLALGLCALVMPEVKASIGKGPILPHLVSEILLGLAIGTCGRLILTAMESAGSFMAQSIGLAFAQVVDPTQGQQGEILATFMRMAGVAMIFAADLHHLAITGIVGSYQALPVGSLPVSGDALSLILRLITETFRAAVGIAAPFIVFGFVFNLGLGFASRLTPQLQLFFLAMPLSVALGFAALSLTMGASLHRFADLAAHLLSLILPVH